MSTVDNSRQEMWVSINCYFRLVVAIATSNLPSPEEPIFLERSLVTRAQVAVYQEARAKGFQAACILGSAVVVILCAPYDSLSEVEQHQKVSCPTRLDMMFS
jgi:hypothetical protein